MTNQVKDIRINIDCSKLTGLIECLSKINEEAIITIEDKKLKCKFMDTAHIMLVIAEMEIFESSKDCEFGLQIEDMTKVLKRFDGKESLLLLVNEKEVKLEQFSKTFILDKIDINFDEIQEQVLLSMYDSTNSSFDVLYLRLNEVIKDCEIFSDVIEFKCEKNIIKVYDGKIEPKYSNTLTGGVNLSEFDNVYAISYMKLILKSHLMFGKKMNSKIVKESMLKFTVKEESPIMVDIKDNGETWKMVFFLAPRVEEEEEDMYED